MTLGIANGPMGLRMPPVPMDGGDDQGSSSEDAASAVADAEDQKVAEEQPVDPAAMDQQDAAEAPEAAQGIAGNDVLPDSAVPGTKAAPGPYDNVTPHTTKGHLLNILLSAAVGGGAGAGSRTVGEGFGRGMQAASALPARRLAMAKAQAQYQHQTAMDQENTKLKESQIRRNDAIANKKPAHPGFSLGGKHYHYDDSGNPVVDATADQKPNVPKTAFEAVYSAEQGVQAANKALQQAQAGGDPNAIQQATQALSEAQGQYDMAVKAGDDSRSERADTGYTVPKLEKMIDDATNKLASSDTPAPQKVALRQQIQRWKGMVRDQKTSTSVHVDSNKPTDEMNTTAEQHATEYFNLAVQELGPNATLADINNRALKHLEETPIDPKDKTAGKMRDAIRGKLDKSTHQKNNPQGKKKSAAQAIINNVTQ